MINLYKEKWEQRKKEIPTNVTNKMTVSVNNESRQNNIEDISSVIVKTEEFDHNEDAHTEKYTTDEFEWVEEDLNLSVDLEEIGSPMERLESEIEDIVEEPEFDVSVEDAFHLIVEPKKALVHESTPS